MPNSPRKFTTEERAYIASVRNPDGTGTITMRQLVKALKCQHAGLIEYMHSVGYRSRPAPMADVLDMEEVWAKYQEPEFKTYKKLAEFFNVPLGSIAQVMKNKKARIARAKEKEYLSLSPPLVVPKFKRITKPVQLSPKRVRECGMSGYNSGFDWQKVSV